MPKEKIKITFPNGESYEVEAEIEVIQHGQALADSLKEFVARCVPAEPTYCEVCGDLSEGLDRCPVCLLEKAKLDNILGERDGY